MTLIEIIVVIVIIGVVMTILVGGIGAQGDKAKAELDRTKMRKVKMLVDQYRLQYSALPNSLEDIYRCNDRTGPGCIPLAKKDEVDSLFGGQYIYRLGDGGRTYQLKTLGADSREGGEGPNYDFAIDGP